MVGFILVFGKGLTKENVSGYWKLILTLGINVWALELNDVGEGMIAVTEVMEDDGVIQGY